MLTYALPTPKEVADHFGSLIDKSVGLRKIDAIDLNDGPFAFAIYDDDQGNIGALCACDIRLASYLGAALSLIPVAQAEESIQSGVIAEMLMENFHEVLNVGAGLFNSPETPRLKLREVVVPPDFPPAEAVMWANEADERSDIQIDVPSYGIGTITLFVD